MQDLLKVLVLLTIFLTPLLGPGKFGYEQTKILFFLLMSSSCGLIWLYLIYQGNIKFRVNKIMVVGGIFIVWLLISSLLGIDSKASLLGAQPYIQGWLTFLFLYLFFLISQSLKIPLKQYALVLSLSATVVSLVAIKEWVLLNIFHLNIPNYAGRVVSSFGQPNLYSGFLLLCLPFSWFLFKNRGLTSKEVRPLCLGLLILQVLGIFLSQSRAALLILLILVIGYLIWEIGKLSRSHQVILGAAIVLVAYLIGAIFYQIDIKKELPTNSQDWLIHNSPEKRIYIWPIFLKLITERPFAGYGLENISTAFSSYFNKLNFNTLNNPTAHSLRDLSVDRTHNYLLDLLMFSGIVGTFFWLVIVYLIFKNSQSSLIKICLAIYLIWIFFQPQGIVQFIYFWVLAGLVGFDSVNGVDKKGLFK